jgi:hypothetical protein
LNDDLIKYYELLGVAPGVSAHELKTAHRDLAKVWHPDRFAHDPRLQQKAQDKLKEINEAYDQLASAKTGRRKPVSTHATAKQASAPSQPETRPASWAHRLLPACGFALIVFVAYKTLIPASKPASTQRAEQAARQEQVPPTEAAPQDDPLNKSRAIDAPRGRRIEVADTGKTTPAAASVSTERKAREMQPLPTVTVLIDPVSGLLAKPECPTKSRMTYPGGSEPHQYCNLSHKSSAPEQEADAPRPKESRLKSFARRLGAPAKLLEGKEASSRNP